MGHTPKVNLRLQDVLFLLTEITFVLVHGSWVGLRTVWAFISVYRLIPYSPGRKPQSIAALLRGSCTHWKLKQ